MVAHAHSELQINTQSAPWTLPSAEEVAHLRAQPNFFEAARTMAGFLAEMYQTDRAMSVVLSDRARTQMAYAVLATHWSKRNGTGPGGITASELKAICVQKKYCSAGRAEVMIAAMRMFGFIEVVKDPFDRRTKILVPTEKHVLMQMARWRKQFTAMSMVMPEASKWLAAMDRADFPPELIHQQSESYSSGIRIIANTPILVPLVNHNCGMPIMMFLTAIGEYVTDAPSSLSAPLTVSGLARRFNVSRAHVRNVLKTAEDLGLVERMADDSTHIVMTGAWRDAFEGLYATNFLHLADCARRAMKRCGPG